MTERVTIVAAGDPMWRGGVSAPHSLYLHADRPLIAGDLTSPLLHEVMHVVLGTARNPMSDWIVEGLAEYYGLELLVRAKIVSRRRYERALAQLAERGRSVPQLATNSPHGAVTARAVTVVHELDAMIRAATNDTRSLDSVLARLAGDPSTVSNRGFRALAEEIAGRNLTTFFARNVWGDQE